MFIFVNRVLLRLQVGEWNENAEIDMFKNETPVWSSGSRRTPLDIPNILKGKTLKIATISVRFEKTRRSLRSCNRAFKI